MQLFVLREGLMLNIKEEFFTSVDNYMLTMGEMLNVSKYPSNTSEMEEYDANRHISKILILSTFPVHFANRNSGKFTDFYHNAERIVETFVHLFLHGDPCSGRFK